MDLFVVLTISFRLFYGLLILQHDRRQILWLGVTAHPTAEWISRQLTEAYGWKVQPRYIVRDRDAVYGDVFIRRLRAMGIRDRPTAARSPWQNGYCERAIGSIRRECLDHVVVFGERHLRHLLRSYTTYYNDIRTHRSLDKDAPVSRPVQRTGSIKSHAILADFTTTTPELKFSLHTGPVACLAVKPAGKPDAGNRHVRFDERGWETGRWPKAQATAPILDSTHTRHTSSFWSNLVSRTRL
jgi:hypothetical protein